MQHKTPLQQKLEKTDWKEIYDEYYGKDVEKELPKGKDLQKHFYAARTWKETINKDVVSKSSVKKST